MLNYYVIHLKLILHVKCNWKMKKIIKINSPDNSDTVGSWIILWKPWASTQNFLRDDKNYT